MNAPSEFTLQFESHAVRVQLDEHERRWFNANDICTALELLNPCAALAQHVDAENVSKRAAIDTIGRTKHVNYLNESGVYALLIGSAKEAAKRFRRWLISEALPAAAAQKAGQHIVPLHHAPSVSTPFQPTEDHAMNEVTPFQFESKDVRIQLDEASAPWFNANDVCSILEFGNPRQAIESHVDVEDVQKLDATDNLGRTRQTNHINESGLYALIMGSTKPAAKRFKRWVTSEVLPTLRKTGTYSTPGAL
ncbi:hypothetical protein FGW84_01560, partial [Xylella fastidiosa subsp. multiplex]